MKRVKDNAHFNVDNLHHYNLYIQVGSCDFQLAVVDPRDSRCLLIEDFRHTLSFGNDHLFVLDRIFDGHHLLKAGFWNHIRVSVKNRRFSLVPTSLFLKDHLAEYLVTNAPRNAVKETYHYYKQEQFKAANVFGVDNYLTEFIGSIYQNRQVHYLHQGSSFLEGILKSKDHTAAKGMYLLFDENTLHVAVCQNKQLEYYNQFPIRKEEEYIRYIVMVMRKLNMSQDKSKVLVWGDFQADSSTFKNLYKYLRHVSFGGKPDYLEYNFMFDEVADHQYFDLLSLHLCD